MTHKKWHTPIKMEIYPKKLLHTQNFLALGSCFAANLENFFSDAKINGLVNPVGIAFNPVSIAKHISYAVNEIVINEQSLGNRNGLYFHDDFHSSFNNTNPAICIENITSCLAQLKNALLTADVLVLSLGSAIVHIKQSNKSIVTNCHKQDAALFNRTFLTIDNIVSELETALDQIKNVNPNLQVLLTVSPIRHAKEGLVENNQSKATLLLACKEMCNTSMIDYFPAYEIMMDELRDYRFYSDDMLHPNQTAVNYIMNLFLQHLFDEKSQDSIKKVRQLGQRLLHRLLHPDSQEAIKFNQHLIRDINHLEEQYPFLHYSSERKMVEERLKI